MLVQQRLPGAVKGTDPGFAGRHIIDAHIGLQVLAGHSFGGGVRVRVQYNSPAAQGGKRPCKANLLPVIGSFFAGCPAVQLRDGNGSHKLCYSNLFLGCILLLVTPCAGSGHRSPQCPHPGNRCGCRSDPPGQCPQWQRSAAWRRTVALPKHRAAPRIAGTHRNPPWC